MDATDIFAEKTYSISGANFRALVIAFFLRLGPYVIAESLSDGRKEDEGRLVHWLYRKQDGGMVSNVIPSCLVRRRILISLAGCRIINYL